GVDGKWGPDKVNFQFTVVNGETYKTGEVAGAGGQGKDAMARISVRVLDTNDSSRVGGLRITGYAAYGRAAAYADRNRYLAMLSYRTKQLTLAGEAAAAQDGLGAATNGHLYSAFGVYKFTGSKAAVIARVDIEHPQAGNTTDKQTRFIGGVSYQLTPNWRLLGDWTTSTSRGRLWWRRTRFAPRPCSRRSSRSNHDEASRMMKAPLLALA